jgi:hypothetical protein
MGPLLFGGGSRTEVLRLVATISAQLAGWIERDHFHSDVPLGERARMANLVRLLRLAEAAAAELTESSQSATR